VSVTWKDRAEELVFEPPQAQLTVPPGERAETRFRAAPRERRWLGREKQHPITAEVAAPDGETQSHSGEVVSRGRIPRWVLPAVGLVVALGVAAALVVPPMLNRGKATDEPTDSPVVTEVVDEPTDSALVTDVVDKPTEDTGPTVGPVEQPTVSPAEKLSKAQGYAEEWWYAIEGGDPDTLVGMAEFPFYYDGQVVDESRQLYGHYQELIKVRAERDPIQIDRIETYLISELGEAGIDPSTDRVVTAMNLDKDDVAAAIFYENGEGMMMYFRWTADGLRMVGLWD
jgi:hypothetical protein